MMTTIVVAICLLLLGLATVFATRRQFVRSAACIGLAILFGAFLFLSDTEISGGPSEVKEAPASPVGGTP